MIQKQRAMKNLWIVLGSVFIVTLGVLYTRVVLAGRTEPDTVALLTVNIRRDTSGGLPYGDTHLAGVSSIVWGQASPNATLEVTLSRSGSPIISRTVMAGPTGSYAVSVDRLIEDNDLVEVYDGINLEAVQVPTITFRVDPVTRVITGTAPGNITSILGGPHSLEVSIGGSTYPITTTTAGAFSIILNNNPYLAGLLGAFCYVTPDGSRVFKPVFVANSLGRGQLEDWQADVILGQPDFSQITFNEVHR